MRPFRPPATRPLLAALVGVALLAGACGSVQTREREVQLDAAVRLFTSAMRWSDARSVAALLAPESGDPPPAVDPDLFRGVKVTDYKVDLAPVDTGRVLMNARFSYYLENTATVRRLDYRGLWWYDTAGGGWRLDGPAPDFRRKP